MWGYFTIIVAVEFEAPQDPDGLGSAITEGGKAFDMTRRGPSGVRGGTAGRQCRMASGSS